MNKRQSEQLEALLDMPSEIIEQMAHTYNVLTCPHHGYCRDSLYSMMREDMIKNYNDVSPLKPIDIKTFDKRYKAFEAALEDINRNKPQILVDQGLPMFLKPQAH